MAADELSQVVHMPSMETRAKGARHDSGWCNQEIKIDVLLSSYAYPQRREEARGGEVRVCEGE